MNKLLTLFTFILFASWPAFAQDVKQGTELENDGVFAVYERADLTRDIYYVGEETATVYEVNLKAGEYYSAGRKALVMSIPGRSKAYFTLSEAVDVEAVNVSVSDLVKADTLILKVQKRIFHNTSKGGADGLTELPSVKGMAVNLWKSTGLHAVFSQGANSTTLGFGKVLMIGVGLLLLALAVFKGFEPLLLVPIGFGCILANIHLAGISGPDGLQGMIYAVGVDSGLFPLLIFMGVGAMTDFGPLIANPKTALLGGAAQFGIFFALIGALLLSNFEGINFDIKAASSIGIIGGADGPTAIYLTSMLAPHLLGSIAVAAYSYMALVPIIQPPIMKAFTNETERKVKMVQTRHVSKLEKVIFPLVIVLLCWLLLPSAAPLIGMLMFGNFMKECGVVERLSSTAQNALINIVTIMLGLAVGSKLSADQFLNWETVGILALGLVAFCIGTAAGVLMAKLMNKIFRWGINPLIGAAGVSAVPMAARVVNKVGLESDPHNFLLMHAMGPNVAGVIGSAVAAGVLLSACSI